MKRSTLVFKILWSLTLLITVACSRPVARNVPGSEPVAPESQSTPGATEQPRPPAPEQERGKNPVWQNQREWSQQEEGLFSLWVKKNWKADFFTAKARNGKKNIFYGIPTDCADAAYAMRVIYSYERKLPFKMYNPNRHEKGVPRFITNDLTNWSDLPETQRVRQFVMYVGDTGSVASLSDDTYPVALSFEGIRSGGISMSLKDSEHVREIIEIDQYGLIHEMNSTLPRARRHLFLTIGWREKAEVRGRDGYRYWIPHGLYDQPVESIPGYSLEQYGFDFEKNAKDHFKLLEEPISHLVSRQLSELCTQIQVRADIVQLTADFLGRTQHRCMSADEWKSHGTQVRDNYLASIYTYLGVLRKSMKEHLTELSPEERATFVEITEVKPPGNLSVCQVPIFDGQTMNPQKLGQTIRAATLSSNPNDTMAARWGLEPSQNVCPKY